VSDRVDPLPSPLGGRSPAPEPAVAARDPEAPEGVGGASPRNGDAEPATAVGTDEAVGADGADATGSADDALTPEEIAQARRRKRIRTWIEWGLVIGGALLVALIVRATLFQAFWIPTGSMEPTLHEGDRVLVNKLSYRLHDVNRGDIVVFERPESETINGAGESDVRDLIKRVIALEGETVEARDGVVYIDGHRLEEPYLPEGTVTDMPESYTVPEGHVFVMGDNRGNSHDSRAFGGIDVDTIVGRAFVRIYPLDDIGGL
jgi:signal peptidase I